MGQCKKGCFKETNDFILQKVKLRKIESVARLDFDWIGQVVDTELLSSIYPLFALRITKV